MHSTRLRPKNIFVRLEESPGNRGIRTLVYRFRVCRANQLHHIAKRLFGLLARRFHRYLYGRSGCHPSNFQHATKMVPWCLRLWPTIQSTQTQIDVQSCSFLFLYNHATMLMRPTALFGVAATVKQYCRTSLPQNWSGCRPSFAFPPQFLRC